MIVTVVNHALPLFRGVLAENLALLRVRGGHRVLLLDATPEQGSRLWAGQRQRAGLPPSFATHAAYGLGFAQELEALRRRGADIVIDSDSCSCSCSGQECRHALLAAQVALVPFAPRHANVGANYGLIARLNSARMFNPGLCVLFVTAAGDHDPPPQELDALRVYAGEVMAGSLADTIVHLPALLPGVAFPGHCASDIESSTGAAEMAALYGEVYRTATPFPPPGPGGGRSGRFLQK
ncbi:hypothetical protein [Massilia sp. Mn16-1_5]|uniref:hypothetical protein n=1 Tax=Massilia sp. Mn16-1_5 TaxID=2079199 RepID=UPI00109EC318|nr:hypothetical protein [Massilia sp. Mn16-1_5]THC43214.1 hypothetical protein C2862_13280 [Massilia sp. Mn16-1_5]